MAISNYLDFWNLVNNEIIGNTIFTIVVGALIVLYISMKNKISFEATLIILVVYCGMIFEKTRNITLWAMLLMIVAILFYYAFNKFFKR